MLQGEMVKPKSDTKRTIVSPNLGTRHIDFIGTWTTIHVKGQINSIQFSVIGHTNLLRNKYIDVKQLSSKSNSYVNATNEVCLFSVSTFIMQQETVKIFGIIKGK